MNRIQFLGRPSANGEGGKENTKPTRNVNEERESNSVTQTRLEKAKKLEVMVNEKGGKPRSETATKRKKKGD